MQNKIRIIIFTLLIGLMVSLTGGCGGGGSGSGDAGASGSASGSGSGGGGGGGGGGTAPSAPTGVMATFSSPTTATVSWNSVSDATSYNIYYSKTSGVTKQNGTKAANVTSPSEIQNLQDNTTYYFVVTAVNSYGESPESVQVSARHRSCSLADLEGIWNVNIFRTGANSGWARGRITLSGTGSATFSDWVDNAGHTATPNAGSLVYSIDQDGVISETGDPLWTSLQYHGIMGSGKNIAVATATDKGSTTWKIIISQKQVTGVTFSNADVTGPISFVFHQLESGLTSRWVRGTGTINSSREVTIDAMTDPSGPVTLPQANYTTLSVDANGIVRSSNEPDFSGIMSPDKKFIIGTNTHLGTFQLRVIQITGQTFGAGDVPCTTNMLALMGGGTEGSWQHGTITSNSLGDSLFKIYLDSIGNSSAPSFIIATDTDGTITRPSETALQFLGTVSYGKDMAVSTYTAASGAYGIIFSLW